MATIKFNKQARNFSKKGEISLTTKQYENFIEFFKEDMANYGHEKDFKEIQKILKKNFCHKLKVTGTYNGEILEYIEVGIDQYPTIYSGTPQRLFFFAQDELIDCILDAIGEEE